MDLYHHVYVCITIGKDMKVILHQYDDEFQTTVSYLMLLSMTECLANQIHTEMFNKCTCIFYFVVLLFIKN